MIHFYRIARKLHLLGIPLLPRLIYIFNRIVFGVVLPPSAKVGKNVVFGYSGLAIVVHKRAQIGENVAVVGTTNGKVRGGLHAVPIIEDGVTIGAGARILGPVRIGRGALIGANAVVLIDVPAGATAVGVPARIVESAAKRDVRDRLSVI